MAVPPGAITTTLPVTSVITGGVITVMVVAFTTLKSRTEWPARVTTVAPVNPVPVIVTVSPASAIVGVNEVIVGTVTYVKDAADVAVPFGVVTVILPLVVTGTTAVIEVALTTLKLVAATPLNFTAVAPVKLVPVSVTVVPLPTNVGLNEVIDRPGINVNQDADVPVPPAVVTVMLPVVVLGTSAEIDVALTTLKLVAATPENLTAVTPVKFEPVIVTVVPAPPDAGVNDVIVGAGINVNQVGDVHVPPAAVTEMLPVVVLGTTAVIEVALTTLKLVAATPVNLTADMDLKLVPVIVTVAPAAAEDGVNDVIVGPGMNVNHVGDMAVPPVVVTEIFPVAAFDTTAVIDVALTTLKLVAATPANLTAVTFLKLVPVIVTVAPAPAEVGVNDVIVGAGTNVNHVGDMAVPPEAVTEMLPVAAVLGTTTVIDVALTTLKLVAATPANLTAVTEMKPVPVIVTVAPAPAEDGVNDVIVGAGSDIGVKTKSLAWPRYVPWPSIVPESSILTAPLTTQPDEEGIRSLRSLVTPSLHTNACGSVQVPVFCISPTTWRALFTAFPLA